MFTHYLWTAVREFRRNLFATLVKILVLAIGLLCFIGAYVAVDYLSSFDTMFPKEERIAVTRLEMKSNKSDTQINLVPLGGAPIAKFLKADFPQLEAVSRRFVAGSMAVHHEGHTSNRSVQVVDPAFLDIFDFDFLAGDPHNALRSPKSVVLTRDAAVAIFGSADVLGKSLLFANSVHATVTGVISGVPVHSHLATSSLNTAFDVLMSMDTLDDIREALDGYRPSESDTWFNFAFTTYALLPADGSLTLVQLNRQLENFADRHIPPGDYTGFVDAIPLRTFRVALTDGGLGIRESGFSYLDIIYGFGALILVIACINFVNLSTAEALRRSKEIGMRKTVGASRGQIVAQSLTESLLMVLGAVLIAFTLVVAVFSLLGVSSRLGMSLSSVLQPDFWLFLSGVIAVVTLLAGGYPALVLSRIRPVTALRPGEDQQGSSWLRNVLVGFQFFVASLFLVLASVVATQNSSMQAAWLEQFPEPYVFLTADMKTAGLDFEVISAEMVRDPSITAVSGIARKLWSPYHNSMNVATTRDTAVSRTSVQAFSVNDNFFSSLGIGIVAGRELSTTHALDAVADWSNGEVNVVLGETAARNLGWEAPRDAIGRQLFYFRGSGAGQQTVIPLTIVGVAEDVTLHLFNSGPSSYVYLLDPAQAGMPVIRFDKTAVERGLQHARSVWTRLAPTVPFEYEFFDKTFESSLGTFRLVNLVIVLLAATGIFIAMIGLFGIAVQATTARMREIGIRKTLGASRGEILKILLWSFSRPVLVANVVAWPIAYALGNFYLNFFTRQAALSPGPFVQALLVTLAVALLVVGGLAWRAASMHPSSVLRFE